MDGWYLSVKLMVVKIIFNNNFIACFEVELRREEEDRWTSEIWKEVPLEFYHFHSNKTISTLTHHNYQTLRSVGREKKGRRTSIWSLILLFFDRSVTHSLDQIVWVCVDFRFRFPFLFPIWILDLFFVFFWLQNLQVVVNKP